MNEPDTSAKLSLRQHIEPTSARDVVLRDVAKAFPGGITAVAPLSLTIPQGQFVALLGPSGCGKSTLLRMIAGLEVPSSGSILQPHTRVAYVFQDAHLLPWRTVLRNVALPRELRGEPKPTREDAAQQVIEQVGLTEFAHRFPTELSGGMRMRASLARALVTQPDMLLLDEPFAALDEITRTQLDVQLRQLWIDRRMTVIFVTHSIGEAAFLADRAIVLSSRPAAVNLDTPIDLGHERSNTLRGKPAYAEVANRLLRALENGAATR